MLHLLYLFPVPYCMLHLLYLFLFQVSEMVEAVWSVLENFMGVSDEGGQAAENAEARVDRGAGSDGAYAEDVVDALQVGRTYTHADAHRR